MHVARSQGGYVTARQARAVGCTGAQIRAGLTRGTLQRAHGNLVRLASWPIGPFDEYAKWCAWFEGAAAISHQSAAQLHGLGRLSPRLMHLSAAGGPRPEVPDVAVRRVRLPESDIESTGSFAVTTPVRTVLDLADAGIAQHMLDEVVGDALAIARVEADQLAAAATAASGRVERRVSAALSATC